MQEKPKYRREEALLADYYKPYQAAAENITAPNPLPPVEANRRPARLLPHLDCRLAAVGAGAEGK
ncbi:hypothetical protein D3C77_400360 [compost metagenome]